MELIDLKPRPSKFKANGNEYILRAWTVEDQIWLQQEYGDKVKDIFSSENIDLMAVCRCVFRLIQDKSDFKAEDIKDVDENGEEINYRLGGWKKLALKLKTIEEQVSAYTALMDCVGLSMPEIDNIRDSVKKKKTMKKKKKQIGRK